MISEKEHAFSIELKSREYITSAAMDCDRRARGVFIEGYLGDLLEVKVIEDALLEISGRNGTFRLDITRKDLARALSKKHKNKESEPDLPEGCC